MICFNHRDKSALGICRECQKALCDECIEFVHGSVSCKETCTTLVNELLELIDTNKKYNCIGKYASNKPKYPKLYAYLFYIMGTIIYSFELYDYIVKRTLNPAIIIFGFFVLLMGFTFDFRYNKKIKPYR